MIKILTNEDLKKLSPEDKAFLTGFCAATDSAASLKMEYLTQMIEECE